MEEPGRSEPHIGANPYAAPPPPAAPAARGEDSSHPIEFTASGSEYFRIWIVNLALTILTLGI